MTKRKAQKAFDAYIATCLQWRRFYCTPQPLPGRVIVVYRSNRTGLFLLEGITEEQWNKAMQSKSAEQWYTPVSDYDAITTGVIKL